MNVRLYVVPLYLWNLTTNFDITWHEVHPYTDSESWKVSFHITHKQKFFINNNFFPYYRVEMSPCPKMSGFVSHVRMFVPKCPDLCPMSGCLSLYKMSGCMSLLRYLKSVFDCLTVLIKTSPFVRIFACVPLSLCPNLCMCPLVPLSESVHVSPCPFIRICPLVCLNVLVKNRNGWPA